MDIGGYKKAPDWVKLGPSLLVAASLVLAIRTAKWTTNTCKTTAEPQWAAEIDRCIEIVHRVLSHLLAKSPQLFASKNVPWYIANDEDVPK